MKICQHSHNRLIDNIGDYLYFKNQRMGASNLKLIHISSTWDCTGSHNFLPMFQKKKDFQKLAGLWLADEVVNHVGIYGSKAAEGLSAFQRRSCFPRASIKFQGHMVQNITDFDQNWAFPDRRPVAPFKSLRFALFHSSLLATAYNMLTSEPMNNRIPFLQ